LPVAECDCGSGDNPQSYSAIRVFHSIEGFRDMMMQVKLALDFTCCACDCFMGVTLQCEGKGLAQENAVAAVRVPCPTCGAVNQVLFEPNGRLRAVDPCSIVCLVPEPSLN